MHSLLLVRLPRELVLSLSRAINGVGSGTGICNDGGWKVERGCGDTEVGVREVLVRFDAGVEQLECGDERVESSSRTGRLKLNRDDIEMH